MNYRDAMVIWQAIKDPREQFTKLAEECSELAVEALHTVDGRDDSGKLVEETADVSVMLDWLHCFYGEEFWREVDRVKCAKMNRNLKRARFDERIEGVKTWGEKE